MSYIRRANVPPDADAVPRGELDALRTNFDIHAGEVFVYQQPIGWEEISEVEVAAAPGMGGLMDTLLRGMGSGPARFHVGLYMGREEAVLPNLSLAQVRFVLQALAYYAPRPVRYTGPEGFIGVVGAL